MASWSSFSGSPAAGVSRGGQQDCSKHCFESGHCGSAPKCVVSLPAQHITDGGMTNQRSDVVRPWLKIVCLVMARKFSFQRSYQLAFECPTQSENKRPERQAAEDDKPKERKPEKSVVSVHSRCCSLMLDLAANCSRQSSGKNTQIVAQ